MRRHIKIKQEEILLLFFSSYVFLINYMQIFSHQKLDFLYYLFIIINILMLLYYVRILNKSKDKEIPRIRWIEYLFIIMILFIDFSKIYHKEYTFVLPTFMVFGKLVPNYIDKKQMKKVIYVNLVGTFPFIFYAMYNYTRYSSYYNNSMGVLLSVNSYFILSLISRKLESKKQQELIFLSLYLLVNLVMTYNTGSRTAILASASIGFYFIYYLIKTAKAVDKEKLILAIPIMTGLLYLTRNQFRSIYNTLFYKWDGSALDFSLTGRTDIWAYTLKNCEVFGGGKSFFIKNLNVSHGHNILFNILGFYGVVPFVLMIVVITYGLYIFLKIDRLNVRLFIILFIIINAFEGVVGGPEYSYFQLLFFLHFGFLMKHLEDLGVSQDG